MGDNSIKEAVSCPIRDFSPVEFPSSHTNLCNSENDNSTSANDERKDSEINCIASKENFSHPNLSLGLTKKIEDAQDSQDSVSNPDLHNGHNNSHSNNDSGELMKEQDTEDLSETMDSPKEASKDTDKNSDRDNETRDSLTMDQESSNISLGQNIEGNSEEEKAPDDSMSQDFFEDDNTKDDNKQPSPDSIEKNDQSNSNDNQDTEISEGFNLHLSQTQSFLPAEKRNDAQVVSESEDETNEVEDESNDKTVDTNDKLESEDVEMSNESSNNTTSTQDVPDGKENSTLGTNNCDPESTKESEEEHSGDGVIEKMEVNDTNDSQEVIGEDEESLSNGEPTSENNCEENSRHDKEVDETLKVNDEKVSESDDVKEEESDGLKVRESEEPQADEENGEALVKSEEPEPSKENNSEKEEEKNVPKELSEESHNEVEGKESVEETKKPKEESLESSEQVKPVTPKVSSRLQRKRLAKQEEDAKQSTTDDKKAEPMEIGCPTNESTAIPETTNTCTCKPSCHSRLGTVSQHLSSACSQLDEFIKLKRREENKLLKNFLDMLKEVHNISENTETIDETKITSHALIPEETGQKRKSLKRKSTDVDTPSKETPRKKIATEEKAPKKSEKKSTIEFKDLKGLAVFAKWPNSGWYYPGKVEELSENDWKEANNVTVKFYDGLVREMKNINILPAYLIPSGSMVCDLEDETEMVVLSCDGSNQNSVDFKLSVKDNSNEIELNFNKLAIRANHMKTIKQQLEPTTDVVPKKMHMVSLDNLVSGRRSSRGRSKKDLDSEESPKTPNQAERRSTSSSSSTPSKKNTKRGKN